MVIQKRGDPTPLNNRQIAMKITDKMEAEQVYLDEPGRDTLMQPSTQAHLLSAEEIEKLRHTGQDIYDSEFHLNQSYLKSTTRSNFAVTPFYVFMESRLTSPLIKLQRQISEQKPPTPFFRIDMTRPDFIVERQSRIAGLGLVIGAEQCYEAYFDPHHPHLEPIGTHQNIIQAIARHIQNIPHEGIVLIITSNPYIPSDKILAYLLSEFLGITLVLLTLDQLEPINGDTIDMDSVPAHQVIRAQRETVPSGWHPIRFILRRAFNLHTIVMIKNYQTLMKAYLANRVGIFPELNLLEDSKLGLACMSLHFIKQDIPEHLHHLYPKAGLLPQHPNDPFYYGDKLYKVDDIINMSRRERKFVLKYAGDDLNYGCFGGRAVYRLFNLSAIQVGKLLDVAMSQTRAGHPWMLQELDLTYYESEYLDKTTGEFAFHNRFHARNMIFYNKNGEDSVKLIDAMLNLRKMWKVSGADDAVITPLYTAPNIDVIYESVNTHYVRRIVTLNN